jgi:nicotinamidase/pyrazinamidase
MKTTTSSKALVIIDQQIDFCPGGALAVPGGDEIVSLINSLQTSFDHVILTQDWHPQHHASFASSHPGKQPFDLVDLEYGAQTAWPDHCVQGTTGAEFHPDLDLSRAEVVIRKGFRPGIDSYSAFVENDRKTATGLAGYLREREIDDLAFVGLALDFCVAYSAIDARKLGFKSTVIQTACRAIDLGGSLTAAMAQMKEAGVVL